MGKNKTFPKALSASPGPGGYQGQGKRQEKGREGKGAGDRGWGGEGGSDGGCAVRRAAPRGGEGAAPAAPRVRGGQSVCERLPEAQHAPEEGRSHPGRADAEGRGPGAPLQEEEAAKEEEDKNLHSQAEAGAAPVRNRA